jgi:hypothetical protein
METKLRCRLRTFKLHELAQKNGDKMTLRKYILLANELKNQEPDLLKQYTAEMK